jgi:hypothetical protein
LLLVSIIRAVVEVAGWFFVGQGVLYLIAGSRRASNPIYRLFSLLTSPVVKITRRMAPRVILDRHVPLLAFFLLLASWVALSLLKQHLCDLHQLNCA